MMRRSPLLLPILVLFALALPAYAATPDEVADAVRDQGFFIDDGLPADPAAISAQVARAGNGGFRFWVVLLDEDPSGGAITFADAVLDRLGDGTVLVLSGGGEGMASSVLDQPTMEGALDAGFSAGGGDIGFVTEVVDQLVGAPVGAGTTIASGGSSSSGGGGGGFIILLVVVAGLVLVVWFVMRRSKKSGERRSAEAIAEARGEIRKQLDAMANQILEISDHVSATSSTEDNRYLQEASATFTEASELFEDAKGLPEVEALSDRLDVACWQLDAAQAVAEGKPVPPKPAPEERHACFFDPTHRGPFEDAELKTSVASARTVRVCRVDAAKLRAGDQPDSRMIEVGGRSVPAASAPRSHGGGGMGAMDVFSVIRGGMAQAGNFNWGGGTASRRSTGWLRGSRSGRTSRRAGSSRSSSSSSSSRRSSSTTRSRAGRTRQRRRR